MCGIASIFDLQGDASRFADAVQRGADAVRHRGPDDGGLYVDGPVALGFRRLAIIDLTAAGHQPMASKDGAWVVVFNGELYNYRQLREELEQLGVRFTGESDTEVLVEALAQWGENCFERFNGMWALLAWHRETQTLLACRDPWGIKPLFLSGYVGQWVGFSSEIKGLRAMGCRLGGVDGVAARRFLDAGELDVDQRTMFSNVSRLRPGFIYRFRAGHAYTVTPYADGTDRAQVPKFQDSAAGEEVFIEAFRNAFVESVQLRLRADVDVGTCLSGGLDSTAIACVAARSLDVAGARTCRHAFTALLPEFNESAYIRPVIERTGAEWHVTVGSDAQILDRLPAFFHTHDEPVHSLSAMAGFLVMGLAGEAGVKVLLNGQGSDEALAGYASSVLPYLRTILREDGIGHGVAQAMAEGGGAASAVGLLLRAKAGLITRKLPVSLEAMMRRPVRSFGGGAAHTDLVREDGPLGPSQHRARPPTDNLQSALIDQVFRSPLPLYLRIEDANSSAFSLESRLPFLDPTVIAMARAAPARMLRRGGLNKYLLRRILPGLVPDVVWQRRDKMGFPVPHARWFRGPLREALTETLAADRLHRRGWYNVKAVTRKVESFLADPTAPFPAELLRLFLMERWAREHLDR